MADILRIVDWEENFENSRTRRIENLRWVPIPNKHDSDGYTTILDHPDGPAHYACWVVITQVASKCHPRGTLLRAPQQGHDSASLARVTRIPQELFESAIPRLLAVGWLERISSDGTALETGCHEGVTQVAPKCHEGVTEGKGIEGKGREEKGREKKGREGKEPVKAGDPPEGLLELIDGWNSLGDSIVKPGNGARRDPPAKAVLAGWKRAQKEPEQRDAFRDIPKVLDAIRQARFCHGGGWFSLPWLFGKNQNGEFNVVKLLAGAYERNANGKRNPNDDPGSSYVPGAAGPGIGDV